MKGNKLTGTNTEIVQLLLHEAGITEKIELLPWARAFKIAEVEKNTIIFSIARTPQRENKFHWIGKLKPTDAHLTKLKSRKDIVINQPSDIKQYKIGLIRGDISHKYLLNIGLSETKNLFLSRSYPELWKNLFKGRIDLVMYGDTIWPNDIHAINENPNELTLFYKLSGFSNVLYIAASKGTDKAIVEKLSKALKLIKKDGRYDTIINRWRKN